MSTKSLLQHTQGRRKRNMKLLSELEHGDKFKYESHTYIKLKKVTTHEEYEHSVFDCRDEKSVHKLFRGDVEVTPITIDTSGF